MALTQHLAPHTSLAIDGRCESIVALTNENALVDLIAETVEPWVVLGGGSNVVFASDYPGTIILNQIAGVECVDESDDHVRVRVGAGENWHQFVLHALERGWYGLENLALIPGTVGAAPIQNIGAYGVEMGECLHSVRAYDTLTKQWQTLSKGDCQLAYRSSIFKQHIGRWIITQVEFCLSRLPRVNVEYAELAGLFSQSVPTPQAVAEAVIAIRSRKLPDPNHYPNAGSFFKNPVISADQLQAMTARWQTMNVDQQDVSPIPSWPYGEGFKVSAAWLIERSGWKGKAIGPVGMSSQHALVLVNRGGTGAQIVDYAKQVQASVCELFGVVLEIEPTLVDTRKCGGC